MKLNIVLYTDGNARPNPGFIGSGAHGYSYEVDLKDEKNKRKENIPTNKGYWNLEDIDSSMYAVQIHKVINLKAGKKDFGLTNNLAECLALQYSLDLIEPVAESLKNFKVCLDYVEKEKYKDIHFIIDSMYVINMLSKIIQNIETNQISLINLETTNSNLEEWLDISKRVKALYDRGSRITIAKVKSHSKNYGNDLADLNATHGIHLSRNNKSLVNISLKSTKESNKKEFSPNPLFSNGRLYYNTDHCDLEAINGYYKYHCGDHGKDDVTFGNHNPDDSYSVIYLKEKDKVIQNVFEYLSNYKKKKDKDLPSLYILHLDSILSSVRYNELAENGLDYYNMQLMGKSKSKSLIYPDKILFANECNPPLLSYKGIEEINHLDKLLNAYVENADLINKDFYHLTEITDKFIKDKKLIIDNSTKAIKLKVKYQYDETDLLISIGIDTPKRNTLNNLSKNNTKLFILTETISETCFKYYFILDCDLGKGIWSAAYANNHFVYKK